MFVYTVRASSVKFFSFIILTLLLVVSVLFFSGGGEALAASDKVTFSGIKSARDRVEFIRSFGLDIDEVPMSEEDFRVPETFDTVMQKYNELQRRQGLDLTRYKGKNVTRYSYNLKNLEGYEGASVVNITVRRGTVVACDISSLEPGGFVLPLVDFSKQGINK